MFIATERVGFQLRQEFHVNVFASETFRQRVMWTWPSCRSEGIPQLRWWD